LLPAALLSYRLAGDEIVPSFLGEQDHPWLRALVDERERFVGRPRHELTTRSREPLSIASPPRKRAVAAHTLESLAVPEGRPGVTARRIRAEVFGAAVTTIGPRDAVLGEVALRLRTTVAAIDDGLFADLPELRPVPPLRQAVAPVDLAPRANLSLVQGLLARADRVMIDLIGNALPIVRRAKLRGLIVNVVQTDETTRMTISGPLALFHHSRLYGRALGSIVPLLAWSTRFVLEARCRLDEGDRMLRVRSGDPIFPSDEPVAFDSALEERFARDLRRVAPTWDVIRDPQPLLAEGGLAFPDFALIHREDASRRWLIELVGFWTPEYIARKLATYRAVGVSNLILCIDERHRCAAGELPQGVRLVWFRKRVDPKAVLAAIGETSAR
jgi:predicted nuclease of restriction endonuclease-like RecB superfamily